MTLSTDHRSHWDRVYATKSHDEVSWFAPGRHASLEAIERLGLPREEPILDVGCGVDGIAGPLLERGFDHVAALDVSAVAIEQACARLGDRCPSVEWFAADLLAWTPPHTFGVWHDRAVFHFLTDAADRARYVELAARAVTPGGVLVLSTFGPTGPDKCSGLPVQRHDEESVRREFGAAFALEESRDEHHVTPSGKRQDFKVFVLRRASR